MVGRLLSKIGETSKPMLNTAERTCSETSWHQHPCAITYLPALREYLEQTEVCPPQDKICVQIILILLPYGRHAPCLQILTLQIIRMIFPETEAGMPGQECLSHKTIIMAFCLGPLMKQLNKER